MQHCEGTAQQNMMGGMQPDMGGMQGFGGMPGMGGMPQPGMADPMAEWNAYAEALSRLDLNELLKDADLNELLKDADLNSLLSGFSITELLTEEQIKEVFGDIDPAMFEMRDRAFSGFGGGFDAGFGGGMGGPRGLESSSDVATIDFVLSRENTGFTNIHSAQQGR